MESTVSEPLLAFVQLRERIDIGERHWDPVRLLEMKSAHEPLK
jgi:hypothetical protein